MEKNQIIKIILIGESGVGKTNLINVLFGKGFSNETLCTESSYFFDGEFKYNDKEYIYNLWDTAGQEQYRALNKIFMKEAKIIILVYSIDNLESFKQIDFWINYAKEILGEEKYIMSLVANKSDLYLEQKVPDQDGKNLAQKYEMKFCITSAKENIGSFKAFLNELIKDYILQNDKETVKNKTKEFKIKKEKVKKDMKNFSNSRCC